MADHTMKRFARLATVPMLSLALLLAGCGGATNGPSQEPPLAGARIGGAFALTDGAGKTVRDTDFAGRYRIVYFGYTFCPDVCPVDLQKIAAGLKAFEGAHADLAPKVVPIFITVDPERDTPEVVGRYVAAFHPRMVGLTGTPQAIAQVARAYAVPFAKRREAGATEYLMDHGTQAYLMGPDGQPIALLPTDQGPEAIARELERWVR
ncbi:MULTISPECIES: SCO family protein [Sphingomonas]|uniref:SCO family protein n=1 Tax=Sphingomonas molluscorum TaxID=418184 RepID=A0ABU8Q2Y2_9SPHN|nr:SCO family protein [Sphingomonas sp. JUb134]